MTIPIVALHRHPLFVDLNKSYYISSGLFIFKLLFYSLASLNTSIHLHLSVEDFPFIEASHMGQSAYPKAHLNSMDDDMFKNNFPVGHR